MISDVARALVSGSRRAYGVDRDPRNFLSRSDFPGSRRDCLRVGIEVFWQNFGRLRNRPRLRRCGFLAKIEANVDCSSCIDAREITPYAFCGVFFIPCFDHSIPRHDKSSALKCMQKRSCHILRPPYPEHLHEGVLTSPLMTR
jgi:hypothetical protein